jgi:hypothetical protein
VTTNYRSLSFAAGLAGLAGALMLSGCSANFGDVSNTPTATAVHIKGIVHGGQQSLNGAHVYMFAASTAGYGGTGIAASTTNASTSLLTSSPGVTTSDGTNFYVTTDQAGNFDINGAFACTPGTQVYLYSIGGDPQLSGFGTSSGANSAAGLMSALGNCASATPSGAFPQVTFVTINEVTTIAAAYALEGFATDPLHIGAPSAVPGHSLSATGIANAFVTASNLVNAANGSPNTTLPLNSTATVPSARINTLADILASCINSGGPTSSGCATLFANTTYGTTPGDTATAAINIAQHPRTNVGALLNLANNASPFQPFVSSATDLTFGINYTGGGLTFTFAIAVDASGNAWIPNPTGNSVTEISNAGVFLSGTTGYTGGGLSGPGWIAIDGSGNAWVANNAGNSVTKLSSTGALLSGATGFTGAGLNKPGGIVIDGVGNAWIANFGGNSVTKLSSTGTPLSGTTGFTGGALNGPNILTVDGSGNAWVANQAGNSVTKLSSTGAVLSGTTGYTGGGLSGPYDIQIDGSGSAWAVNATSTSVTRISNAGAILSGATGYTGGGLNEPVGIIFDGSGNAWISNSGTNVETELSSTGAVLSGANGFTGGGPLAPEGTAMDSSGNLWISHNTAGIVTELIGIGTPVITPLVAGLPVVPTTDGSSNLGTRP